MSYASKALSTKGPDVGYLFSKANAQRERKNRLAYIRKHWPDESKTKNVKLIVANKVRPNHCALLKLVKLLEADEPLLDFGINGNVLLFDLRSVKSYKRYLR